MAHLQVRLVKTNLADSLVSQYPPDPGDNVFEKVCYINRLAEYPSAMVQVHPSKSQAKDD